MTARARRRDEQRKVLVVSLILAALLQPVSWVSWRAALFLYPRPTDAFSNIPIDIIVDEEDDEEKKRSEEAPDSPVVDITPPTFEDAPDVADYVAAYDSNPAKEMKPKLAPEAVERSGPPPSPDAPRRKVDASKHAEDPGSTPDRVERLKGLPSTPGDPKAEDEVVAPPLAPSIALPTLLPDLATSGISVDDYLPDVPEGPGKLIRAKRYVHAVFFNRLARDVKRHWHADKEYLRHDPSGEVYGIEDRYTQVYVKLSRTGEILEVAVAKSSGLDFLDEEALSALKKAAPFHHPPAALADSDGYIRFFFGFYLEVNGSPKVRVFRY